jgi:hypothetical protein
MITILATRQFEIRTRIHTGFTDQYDEICTIRAHPCPIERETKVRRAFTAYQSVSIRSIRVNPCTARSKVSGDQITISDLDGVIIDRWSPGDYDPRPGPRPGPADAILTNQGGVPLRWCGFVWARKYPTLRQVLRRVRAGMQMSGARRALVALYHPRQEQTALGRLLAWLGKVVPLVPVPVAEGVILLSFSSQARKPSPWGILVLSMGRPAVFCGDEETDRLAAEAAGAEFVLVQRE